MPETWRGKSEALQHFHETIGPVLAPRRPTRTPGLGDNTAVGSQRQSVVP